MNAFKNKNCGEAEAPELGALVSLPPFPPLSLSHSTEISFAHSPHVSATLNLSQPTPIEGSTTQTSPKTESYE